MNIIYNALCDTHTAIKMPRKSKLEYNPQSKVPRALNAASLSKSSANHKAPLKTVRCN